MINLDHRLFDIITDSEAWLLLKVASCMDVSSNEVVLKNKTIQEKTGYSLKKIQSIKASLQKKGIMYVVDRTTSEGGKACNAYEITTNYISLYIPSNTTNTLCVKTTQGHESKGHTVSQNDSGGMSQNDSGGMSNFGGVAYSPISSITPISLDNKTKGGKPLTSIQSFLNDLPDLERLLCERFIKHRKLLKKPVASIIGLKTFLGDLKRITEDQSLWPVILDQYEQTEWQSVKWIKLEDIPSTEPIPLGYRLAAMRCGAKTDAEIRKLIPKFEGLNPDMVGLWFRINQVVPDAENVKRLPEWLREMKQEKLQLRNAYAKEGADGVKAILEKSIEFTKTKL